MDHDGKNERKLHPRERAGLFSKITFLYTIGLFWKTYRRRKFDEEALYEVLSTCQSHKLGHELESSFEKDIKKHGSPSIYRLLWSCWGYEYVVIGIVQMMVRTLVILTIPFTLSKVVLYFTPNQQELTKRDASLLAVLLIVLCIVNATYIHNYLLHLVEMGLRIRTAFCSLIYRKCLKLTPCSLSRITVGKIVTLMTKDVEAFEKIIFYWNDVWIGFVQAGIVCYLIFARIGVAAFFGVGLYFAVMPCQIYLGKVASKLRIYSAQKTDERLQTTQEALSAIKIIKMYTWERNFEKKVTDARKAEIYAIVKIFMAKTVMLLIGGISSKIALYLMIMTYVWLGNMITAELIFFLITLLQRIRHALNVAIPLGITVSAELYAAVNRIENLLKADEVSDMVNMNELTKSERKQVTISLENLSVDIKNFEILRDLTLTFESGLTFLTGPLGCGKTSLLKSILKEYVPKSGTVCCNGTVSYASQEPWIFPSTLKQNILFGMDYDQARYATVLHACALDFDINNFEEGDNLIAGDKGLNLSKGQKARIDLARAVYKDSDIYLLDDCLTALDGQVQDHVFEKCIRQFLNKKLCIFVTQDLKYVTPNDNLVVIEKGSVKLFQKGAALDEIELTLNTVPAVIAVKESNNNEHTSLEGDGQTEETNLLEVATKKNIYHEEKKSGKVGWDVYSSYITFGGGYVMFILVVTLFFATQASRSYVDKMVSDWVNLEHNLTEHQVHNLTHTETYKNLSKSRTLVLELYSIFTLLLAVLSIFSASLLFNFTRKASNGLHYSMTTSILNASMSFFDFNRIGNILNRYSKDLAAIDEHFPFALFELFEIFFGFCGILILIAYVNLMFLLPTLVILVVFYFIRELYMPTGRNLQRLDATTRSPVVGYVNASLEGLTTIRAFRAQNLVAKEFDRHQDLNTSANYTSKCYARAFGYALDITCSAFMAIIVAKFFIFENDTLVGSVGLAITQAFMLTGVAQYGIRQWAEVENKMTSVERVLEYSKVEQENRLIGKTFENWPKRASIIYEDVSLIYNGKEQVLRNLNFSIESGEKIGIVGRTGAGKSSIISTLFRLYDYQGKITIDGTDIKTISLDFLRSHISIIPQDPVLFTGSIRSNIDPMKNYNDEEIWKAIEQVKLRSLVASLDLEITEPGSNFCAGQRQLICLARAIVSKNKIIVLDEATASLDREIESSINVAMNDNFASCTVITIAHRLKSVLSCDRVMVVEDGTIVEYDTPETLKCKKGDFCRMLEAAGLL